MKRRFTLLSLAMLISGLSMYAASDLTQNEDGVYLINNASDLVAFSDLVNGGKYTANAMLTTDIDMSEYENFTPIGTYTSSYDRMYKGTFDGQGHKISHLTINKEGQNQVGLFNTGDNVVLKNFWLDETCEIKANEDAGLIGLHWGIGAKFEGLGNAGNINTTDGTTASEYINRPMDTAPSPVYDILGRMHQPSKDNSFSHGTALSRGIYISSGKKLLVR